MTKKRTNNRWNKKEDQALAAIVLDGISKGFKMKDIYKQAGKKLKRSDSSVRSHWVDVLRIKYLKEIQEAKNLSKHTLKNIKKLDNNSNGDITKGLFSRVNPTPMIRVSQIGAEDVMQFAPPKNESEQSNIHVQLNDSNNTTKLKKLLKDVKTLNSEKLSVLNSGDKGIDFVVVDGDFAYLVNTKDGKALGCNCQDDNNEICKHMLKVALIKDLEVF